VKKTSGKFIVYRSISPLPTSHFYNPPNDKSQVPNSKFQIISKSQLPNENVYSFDYLDLFSIWIFEFRIYLLFGACYLEFIVSNPFREIPSTKSQIPNNDQILISNSEILDDFIPIYFPEENVLIGANYQLPIPNRTILSLK
jgi:hypothetical protein